MGWRKAVVLAIRKCRERKNSKLILWMSREGLRNLEQNILE
jgi:hypothetical protein